MTQEEAIQLAKEHVKKLNQDNPHSDIMNWIESEPLKTAEGYYFDYKFEFVNSENSGGFGGAPGYLIEAKTGEIHDISWEKYQKLMVDFD